MCRRGGCCDGGALREVVCSRMRDPEFHAVQAKVRNWIQYNLPQYFKVHSIDTDVSECQSRLEKR